MTVASDPSLWTGADLCMKGKDAPTVTAAVGSYGDCVMERKLDGHRVLFHIGQERVRMFAGGKAGREKSGKLDHVEDDLLTMFPPDTWVDGEAVARGGHELAQGVGKVQSVLGSSGVNHRFRHELEVVLFDVLAYNGIDVRTLPLANRREALEKPWVPYGENVRLSELLDADEDHAAALIDAGFEGVMVKRLSSLYRSGKRGPGWWKVKAQETADAIITGYEPGKAGFAGLVGAVIFSQYRDGKLVQTGQCSGMDMATRRAITVNQLEYMGRPFEFKFFGYFDTGGYRHANFVRWRGDKSPAECEDTRPL